MNNGATVICTILSFILALFTFLPTSEVLCANQIIYNRDGIFVYLRVRIPSKIISAVINQAPKPGAPVKEAVREGGIVQQVHHHHLRVWHSFTLATPTTQAHIILMHITANRVLAQRKFCVEKCSTGLLSNK